MFENGNNNNNIQFPNSEQFSQPSAEFSSAVSGVEKVTKKKKGKKIAIISGSAAAVLVGGGVVAYNFSPFIKNQVKLRTMKPDKYLAWVNEENSGDFAKSIAESYDNILKKYEGSTGKAAIEYTSSDESAQNLMDLIFDEEDEAEDKAKMQKVINNIKSLQLGVDYSVKKPLAGASSYISLNDDKLVSFDYMADLSKMDIFARIPQLTEQYLSISMAGEIEKSFGRDEDAKKIYDTLIDVMKNPEKYVSPDDLESELVKYIGVWNDSLKRVKLEKSEKVDILDISVKYTVAKVTIDEETGREIACAFLEEAKEDEYIKELVVKKLGVTSAKKYAKFFDELIDDLKEEDEEYSKPAATKKSSKTTTSASKKKYDDDDDYDEEDYYDDDDYDRKPSKNDDEDSENVIYYYTYIDPTGTIRGISVEVQEGGSKYENKLTLLFGKEDSAVRGEFSLIADSVKLCDVQLKAEEKGKKYSGTLNMTFNEERHHYYDDYEDESDESAVVAEDSINASIEFKDFELTDKKKGYINGDFTFIIPGVDAFDISFDSSDNEQKISYDIDIKGKNYGKVSLIYSIDEGSSISRPKDTFEIDLDADELPDMSKYIKKDDLSKFINDVIEKVGLDKGDFSGDIDDLLSEIYDVD